MIGSRSIGLSLKDVLSDEKIIVDTLMQCRESLRGEFKVIFFNEDVPSKEVKDFLQRNSEAMFKIHTKVTVDLTEFVFFLIEHHNLLKDVSWRYKYQGSVLGGLEEYSKLIQFMYKRDRRGIGGR